MRLVPFEPGHSKPVLAAALEDPPVLIGFSIVFQWALDAFGELAASLRKAGVTAHFTCGGHYPSLCPERILRQIPQLDSVVRFEGEETLTELLDALLSPERWSSILGLAFRRDGNVILSPPRPLIENLDALPWPPGWPSREQEPRTRCSETGAFWPHRHVCTGRKSVGSIGSLMRSFAGMRRTSWSRCGTAEPSGHAPVGHDPRS